MNYVEAVKFCRSKVNNADPEELVPLLKAEGFDILTSMKIIRESFKISLGQAKQIVAENLVWKKESKKADLLHQKLIEEFKNME